MELISVEGRLGYLSRHIVRMFFDRHKYRVVSVSLSESVFKDGFVSALATTFNSLNECMSFGLTQFFLNAYGFKNMTFEAWFYRYIMTGFLRGGLGVAGNNWPFDFRFFVLRVKDLGFNFPLSFLKYYFNQMIDDGIVRVIGGVGTNVAFRSTRAAKSGVGPPFSLTRIPKFDEKTAQCKFNTLYGYDGFSLNIAIIKVMPFNPLRPRTRQYERPSGNQNDWARADPDVNWAVFHKEKLSKAHNNFFNTKDIIMEILNITPRPRQGGGDDDDNNFFVR